jgi:hypothetical protein
MPTATQTDSSTSATPTDRPIHDAWNQYVRLDVGDDDVGNDYPQGRLPTLRHANDDRRHGGDDRPNDGHDFEHTRHDGQHGRERHADR